MKKILPVLFVCFILSQIINAQNTEIPGSPIAEIFTDFHYNINDTAKTTGFGINRAYLGYKFQAEGNFSSTIIFNIGNPDDLAEGSLSRRYGFFREASITYSQNNLNLSFGIANTRIFRFQQRFWGKRYVASEYQSIYGYGTVADLGMVLDYKLNEKLAIDFALMNGEGYSSIQLDNNLKTSFGLTITPVNQVSVRLYSDIMKANSVWQTTLIAFAGYKNDIITFGAEASYKSNIDIIKGHHAWGLSATGSISIARNTELFARYDYSSSVLLDGETIQWNYLMDRSFAISGIQYTFNQYVKMALDYQGTFPHDPAGKDTGAIFINAHFKF